MVALLAVVVGWLATYAARPAVRPIALRGLGVAALVSLILGVSAGVAAAIFFGNDRDLMRIFGPVMLGVVVAVFVGVGYLMLNVVVLTAGLWFQPTRSWATTAALATPVVLAAIGFGYVTFRAYPV